MSADRTPRSTTVLAVIRNDRIAMASDGQITVGDTVVKQGAQKVRRAAKHDALIGLGKRLLRLAVDDDVDRGDGCGAVGLDVDRGGGSIREPGGSPGSAPVEHHLENGAALGFVNPAHPAPRSGMIRSSVPCRAIPSMLLRSAISSQAKGVPYTVRDTLYRDSPRNGR